jgi:hypothetical protein
VIANSHCGEVQLIQCLGNLLSTVERVKKSALELISNIEPEAVVVIGSLLLNYSFDASVAAITPSLGTRTIGS